MKIQSIFKFKNLSKYIIYTLILLFLSSCGTAKDIVKNKELEELKVVNVINTEEERLFFLENKIPSVRKGFYDVFFSYIQADYDKFYKLSNIFMEDEKSPKVLKFWISLKYLNLFKRDILSFEDTKDFYLKNINLKFSKILLKEVESLYKQYFMLKKSNVNNFNLLNKWNITGPYKFVDKKSLINFDFENKHKSIFVENKEIDFKNGGITIPEGDYNIYGGVYKLTSNINIENDDVTINFTNIKIPFLLMIDDKLVFSNDSLLKKRSREIINVKLKKGNHKFSIILVELNKEIYLHTDSNIKFVKKAPNNSSKNIQSSSLYDDLIKELYELKKYSYSFKSIIAAELSMDFIDNVDEFYRYLTKIQEDNFYKNYLYYSFYNNFFAAGKIVRNKNMQKYIKKSIGMNKSFHKTQMEYVVLLNKPNSYEVLSDLNNIKQETFWFLKLKATYLKKANLIKEFNEVIDKMYSMKNGKVFLYKYFMGDINFYNYPLYTKISEGLNKSLLYKMKYSKTDIDYILNEVKNAPYSRNSFYLLSELSSKDENIKSNPIYNNFKNDKLYQDMDNSLEDFELLLNDKNSKNFVKANLFLKKWSEYIKFEDTKDIIKKFKTKAEKESFPTTKLLDYDITFIEKDYWVLVNRRIIKINNSQGLRRYSSLNRRENYLKLMTISDSDLKEYQPSFGDNTSEISLKKLKVGDYIELITYQTNYVKLDKPITKLISFKYKDFNQTVVNAKLDLYISDYFSSGERKLFINSLNGFDLSKLSNKKHKNYTLYQYNDFNLKGVKSEPYGLKSGELLFPMLLISGKMTWKEVYKQIQLFMDYLEGASFTKDIIKSYGKVKTIDDLKKLYFDITKNMKHSNQYYSYFDSMYLNKSGNLVYFLKMILDKNKIDSEILIFHSKYNFRDKQDVPSLSYYNIFILKVNFKGKTYYLDPSTKWNTFNELPHYVYNQFFLRIDKDHNVFKEKLKDVKKIETKTNFDVVLNNDGTAKVNLKIEIPSALSSNLKGFLSMQTDDKIKMIFNSLLAKKMGFVSDFKVNLSGHKDIKAPLIIDFNFVKNNFAHKQGDKLIISNLLNKEFATQLYNYATLKDYTMLPTRTLPLLTHYFNDNYTINIKFPKNYKPVLLKETNGENEFAKYNIKISIKENSINIFRKYYIGINKIPVENYKELKEMAEKIKSFKQQDISAQEIK